VNDDPGPGDVRLLAETGLGRGSNVVEFGCGSGALSRLLARAVGPAGRVLGLDLSAFNVARARELASEERLDNALFEVADLRQTRAATDYADVTVARNVLGHVSAPELVVKEMLRVTRPSGVVAALDADEGLVVYEPEPPVLAELRDVLARDRMAEGGNQYVGRSLYRLLAEAGLAGVRAVALPSNSTDPEWSTTRDPASHTAVLARAVDGLVERGKLSAEEASRYQRALHEVTHNPAGFIFVCSFFVWGRKPLRCA
jgi:ubiquinone/menaquinone biosynthesis C-methylase UbiE